LEFDVLTSYEFVGRVERELQADAVIDINLEFPIVASEIPVLVSRAIERGFVRGRINGDDVRFEEWSPGEDVVESFYVTVDRIKGSSTELRARVLHAFSLAPTLDAARICASQLLDNRETPIAKTPIGAVCVGCGTAALVGVSAEVTLESIKQVTIFDAAKLVSKIVPTHSHPDGLILNDLLSRLRCAKHFGLGELRLDRPLQNLSTGERYRLALTARVFADVHGLKFELKDPAETFGGKDAKGMREHIRFLSEECGAEVEFSQLEACLAPEVLIGNVLSITALGGGSGEVFTVGAGLNGVIGAVNSLNGLSGSGKSRLLAGEVDGFKRIVRLGSDDRRIFKNKTVGALLGLAKPLKEFYSNHPHTKVVGLKPKSFSGLLPGERSRSTQREYDLLRTVKFKGLSYDETLRADVGTLFESFRHFPRLGYRLKLLKEIGLDFVRPIDLLREFTPPVQRMLRLVEAVAGNPAEGTLFILDGMLAGLTADQQRRSLKQLELLCSRGATVVTTNLFPTSVSG
jgi:hypothetical protein